MQARWLVHGGERQYHYHYHYHYRARRGGGSRKECISESIIFFPVCCTTNAKRRGGKKKKRVNKYDKTCTWSLGAMAMDPAASGCRLFGFGSNDDGCCCLSADCLGRICFDPGKGVNLEHDIRTF